MITPDIGQLREQARDLERGLKLVQVAQKDREKQAAKGGKVVVVESGPAMPEGWSTEVLELMVDPNDPAPVLAQVLCYLPDGQEWPEYGWSWLRGIMRGDFTSCTLCGNRPTVNGQAGLMVLFCRCQLVLVCRRVTDKKPTLSLLD